MSFHCSLLLNCSLHFSSCSVFHRYLFTPSSHFSCRLPHFLQPRCFFVSYVFGNLSPLIPTMCPAHWPTSLRWSFGFLLSLHQLFYLSSCSHIPLVCFVAVRTETPTLSHTYRLTLHMNPGPFPSAFWKSFYPSLLPSTCLRTSNSTHPCADCSIQLHNILYLLNIIPFQSDV